MVGKVTPLPPDSCLDRFGIAALFEQDRIVVGLEVSGVNIFQDRRQPRKWVTQIGQNPQPLALALDHKRNAVGGIVWRTNGMNPHFSEFERIPR